MTPVSCTGATCFVESDGDEEMLSGDGHSFENEKVVAEAFVTARRTAHPLAEYPGDPPTELAASYRIQDHAIRVDGRSIGGWKVGRINPPFSTALGEDRLAGPVFADAMVDAADGVAPDMPVFAGGFAAVEAELLLHVPGSTSGRAPSTNDEAAAIVDAVRLGIEVASSPYPRINADGPLVTVSDFGNNAGLVLGPKLTEWRSVDLCAIPVRTEIEGRLVGEATAATMLDGPYGAVRFLLANLAQRGIGWAGGLWISTGAITGVHPAAVGEQATATFGAFGRVACGIVAARSD